MRIYQSKISIWPFVAGMTLTILFIVNGIGVYHKIMAGLFFVFSIIALTHKRGIELSENLMIRNFSTIIGISFGKWERLPNLSYISIVRVKQNKYRMTGGFIDQAKSNRIAYQLILIFKNGKNKKLLSTNKTKAINLGIEIGDFFSLKVLDHTTPDYHWLDPKTN